MVDPDLSGQVALVTGSATGIGRELLLSLAAQGADVAVQYRSSDAAAHEVAETARKEGACSAIAVQADVTDQESVDSLFSSIEGALGSVDVLVNNVGAFAPVHWTEMDVETWDRVVDTNLKATYLCCRRALPNMSEQEYGRIVNVGYASSDKGLINAKNAPFFIAKAGVLMFTRMLAGDTQEDGITVNAVSPYVVENSDEFPSDLPRNRPASFEDMTQAVQFFLEAESDYISGANIEVDGGWVPETV